MADSLTVTTNAPQVAALFRTLAAALPAIGEQLGSETAILVAGKAKDLAHVGKDPTSPKGRPHTRDTVRAETHYVLAEWGAVWEEARGGDHAFLTNALAAEQADCVQRGEQLLGAAIERIMR